MAGRKKPLEMTYEEVMEKLHAIKERKRENRKKSYRRGSSRLDPYHDVLATMKRAGAKYTDMAEWLKVDHQLVIHPSNISRYLKRKEEKVD